MHMAGGFKVVWPSENRWFRDPLAAFSVKAVSGEGGRAAGTPEDAKGHVGQEGDGRSVGAKESGIRRGARVISSCQSGRRIGEQDGGFTSVAPLPKAPYSGGGRQQHPSTNLMALHKIIGPAEHRHLLPCWPCNGMGHRTAELCC